MVPVAAEVQQPGEVGPRRPSRRCGGSPVLPGGAGRAPRRDDLRPSRRRPRRPGRRGTSGPPSLAPGRQVVGVGRGPRRRVALHVNSSYRDPAALAVADVEAEVDALLGVARRSPRCRRPGRTGRSGGGLSADSAATAASASRSTAVTVSAEPVRGRRPRRAASSDAGGRSPRAAARGRRSSPAGGSAVGRGSSVGNGSPVGNGSAVGKASSSSSSAVLVSSATKAPSATTATTAAASSRLTTTETTTPATARPRPLRLPPAVRASPRC